MIILNFMFLTAFCILAEVLRTKVFHLSKILRRPSNSSVNPLLSIIRPKQKPTSQVRPDSDMNSEQGKDHRQKVIESIPDDLVKDLATNHYLNAEKREELETQKKEGERYNNQDFYAKYAKIQRQLLAMEKTIKLSKFSKTQF